MAIPAHLDLMPVNFIPIQDLLLLEFRLHLEIYLNILKDNRLWMSIWEGIQQVDVPVNIRRWVG